MSREYEISIDVDNSTLTKKACEEIEEALSEEGFVDFNVKFGKFPCFYATARYNLGGGWGEEQEVERLQGIVWGIAGKFVQVGISMTYIPGEYYAGGEKEFERWQRNSGKVVKRCRICDELIKEDEASMKETDFDDVCWGCEDSLCKCGKQKSDEDDKMCAECKVAEAEAREDR